ncbi:glutathione hydrolase 1 proenzyme [Lingula anatina]|uniref:Glutathione hydrolase 1 proenzyme n=1 Tax=Lingula anatina TaxID=7574 RepID=A0A2R2MIC2_LINAN|nr:glutathione hydrolase 1 proenzyme [Lingula anatina]|eukprot:XP_023929971.1 glutathione hydrolase 1 proenzyme [Lingula anatina]
MKESLQNAVHDYRSRGQVEGKKQPKRISFRKRCAILLVFVLVVAAVGLIAVLIDTGTIPVGGTSKSSVSASKGGTTATVIAADDPEAPPSASRLGEYRFAAVAADAGECSEVGTEFLVRYGSAVDAAIASLLCIGVHNPHSMGLGGGFFMTVYNRANKTAYTIDAREQAPASANETMFTNNPSKTASTIGGLAIGVPGEIRGYWLAHQRFGKLPWRELFVPSIKMCRSGIKVGNSLENALRVRKREVLTDTSLRANKTAYTIDAREQAPASAIETMFTNNPSKTASTIGGLAIGVPGEIRGYWLAHQRFGKLPWRELFVPSIKMCRSGIKVGNSLENALRVRKREVLTDTSLSEVFAPNGNLLKAGETMYRFKLADTLEKIANATDGGSEFYDSELTQDIVDEIQAKGGIITRQDMRDYKAKEKKPLVLEMQNGMKVFSPRPPSGGAVYQFILNILQGYNFTAQELHRSHAVRTHHRMVEAMKFAYAKRTELGDEDFLRNTTLDQLVKNMTSLEFGDHIRSLITDNTTHGTAYYGPTFYDRMTEGTSHLSVLAGNGDAVSVTSTINLYLGSRVRGNKTGIIYNDEMDDFSSPNITNAFGIPPSPNNFIRPGKRPLSSMCPTIVVNKNGDVILVVGASGGTRITTAIAYVTARTLWFGENIKQAIDARRIHHQLLPPEISYEEGFRKVYISGLRALNHNLTERAVGGSVVQGIHRSGSAIYANSDFRKGGYPDGF